MKYKQTWRHASILYGMLFCGFFFFVFLLFCFVFVLFVFSLFLFCFFFFHKIHLSKTSATCKKRFGQSKHSCTVDSTLSEKEKKILIISCHCLKSFFKKKYKKNILKITKKQKTSDEVWKKCLLHVDLKSLCIRVWISFISSNVFFLSEIPPTTTSFTPCAQVSRRWFNWAG